MADYILTKWKASAVFVSYVTAGFPKISLTPNILVALQDGGTDVIELGKQA
jgi:tryptophan synthase alpha subunit